MRTLFLMALGLGVLGGGSLHAKERVVDVCVYGATPSGIMAAIAVKRAGKSVVIVEPSRWVGGMLGAGLKPLQDCPNYAATGGMTRTLLPELGAKGAALKASDRRALNPAAIRDDFVALLEEHAIEVMFEHRVSQCEKVASRIMKVHFDFAPFDALGCPVEAPQEVDSLGVQAKCFIDASYEGSFMPLAQVGYRVGREAAETYDEEYAGVQPLMEVTPIDPFRVRGDPSSGLLKWVEADHGKPMGASDGYTQAYNYRYYTTNDPEYRLPLTQPDNYQAIDFELVGRTVEHLASTTADQASMRKKLVAIFPGWMNSGEWNYQRESLFSMAPLGVSQRYADGDAAEQARVWKLHQDYLRGLAHFMRTDPRVPSWYRDEVAELGLDRRAHEDTQGWPHQLYIRVARRLNGRYTITAKDVYNQSEIDDPIGLAQYGIDTYPSRRVFRIEGDQVVVGIEGKMFIGGSRGPTNRPYPIPYRAITPQTNECENLLVPVCFSASHLGYASARMEPVFMICGESAGVAACHAIDEGKPVQGIDLGRYLTALRDAGQKLVWDPTVDRAPQSDTSSAKYSMKQLLEECDVDGDGLVSKREWDQGKSGWEWLFAKIDVSGEGQIDGAEYARFQEYKAEHPNWQKELR